MRVLLIEPYLGGSHRVWAEGYAAASGHEVTIVSHPGSWWAWRMRGAALTLARDVAELAADGYRPDVVLVSSMVDVAALRSFLHPSIGRPPLAVYFHESQLAYPPSPQQQADTTLGLLNWTSAVAADGVYFNSGYHHDVFFEATHRLLVSFPDHPHTGFIAEVAARAAVLPVGVDLHWSSAQTSRGTTPVVLWNHRWDHDKDPETFADGIRAVAETHDFRLALAGERLDTGSRVLDELTADMGDRIEVNHHLDLEEYRALLLRSDIVVSTAVQEFFGISIVEAVAAGARPVLPRRLSYPWLIPGEHHATVLYAPGSFAAALRSALDAPHPPDGLRQSMSTFDWSAVAPRYDAALEAL